MEKSVLTFKDVKTGYGKKEIIHSFSAEIKKGEFVGLIGGNGAGKSTLLKTVYGLLPTLGGEILVHGVNNQDLSQRERAKQIAVVPQSFDIDYDFLVEDIVMMGRNPYLSFKNKESQKDWDIVEQAMKVSNTLGFKGRLFNDLSGGEKQRVIIARAIAQETGILLLDEPTSALDLHHQIEVMEMIQNLNIEKKITVVAVLHDLNLAARYCERLIMIKDGLVIKDGLPQEVITHKSLSKLYGLTLLVKNNPIFRKPEIIPLRITKSKTLNKEIKIHVVGGGGHAALLLDYLHHLGVTLSLGVIAFDDDDWLMGGFLNIEMVTIPPFSEVTETKQQEQLALMRQADWVIVSDLPWSDGNLASLTGLTEIETPIITWTNEAENDFASGQATEMLENIFSQPKNQIYESREALLRDMENQFASIGWKNEMGDSV